jgi:hypothetical protein
LGRDEIGLGHDDVVVDDGGGNVDEFDGIDTRPRRRNLSFESFELGAELVHHVLVVRGGSFLSKQTRQNLFSGVVERFSHDQRYAPGVKTKALFDLLVADPLFDDAVPTWAPTDVDRAMAICNRASMLANDGAQLRKFVNGVICQRDYFSRGPSLALLERLLSLETAGSFVTTLFASALDHVVEDAAFARFAIRCVQHAGFDGKFHVSNVAIASLAVVVFRGWHGKDWGVCTKNIEERGELLRALLENDRAVENMAPQLVSIAQALAGSAFPRQESLLAEAIERNATLREAITPTTATLILATACSDNPLFHTSFAQRQRLLQCAPLRNAVIANRLAAAIDTVEQQVNIGGIESIVAPLSEAERNQIKSLRAQLIDQKSN